MSALENFKLHMWLTFRLDSTGRDYQVQGRGGVCEEAMTDPNEWVA